MNEGDDTEINLRDGPKQIDLTNRLRFAAGSLAADFGEGLSVDHAEALVFSSAEGLLAAASVTEFVPILAERRARLAVRSAALGRATSNGSPAAPVAYAPVAAAPTPAAAAPADPEQSEVMPLLAVPDRDLTRLRNDIERARMRVSDWRADLRRQSEPAT